MSTVISSDKHYKDISSKIRAIFQTDSQYKPSEMSQAILNMKNMATKYASMKNGFVFFDNGE